MFFMPMMVSAWMCSRVCGWGQSSFAEMRRSAPSMMFAPQSMVAMRLSCPGESTSEIFRASVFVVVFLSAYASGLSLSFSL